MEEPRQETCEPSPANRQRTKSHGLFIYVQILPISERSKPFRFASLGCSCVGLSLVIHTSCLLRSRDRASVESILQVSYATSTDYLPSLGACKKSHIVFFPVSNSSQASASCEANPQDKCSARKVQYGNGVRQDTFRETRDGHRWWSCWSFDGDVLVKDR